MSIYSPRSQEYAKEDTAKETRNIPRGSERIVVVEDDESVRKVPVSYLREQGYEITEATDGKEAVTQLQEGTYDLLSTDVVLPGSMSGVETASEAKRLKPNLMVPYTSGYGENAVDYNGHLDDVDRVIRKPYAFADLGQEVRAVLDNTDD